MQQLFFLSFSFRLVILLVGVSERARGRRCKAVMLRFISSSP